MITPPWEATIYTPLFFLLGAPFQLSGTYNYWGLRLISIVSFLVSIVVAYRLFSLYCKDRLAVTIALITYSSFVPTWGWSWKGRVDMLSIALSIAALYLFELALRATEQGDASVQSDAVQTGTVQSGAVQSDAIQTGAVQTDAAQTGAVQTSTVQIDAVQTDAAQTGESGAADKKAEGGSLGLSGAIKGSLTALKVYCPSILLLVAAVYSKQSSIMILPAVCLVLIAKRRWFHAAIYAAMCLLLCGALAAVLQLVTAGGFLPHMDIARKTQSMNDLLKHLELIGVDWPKIWLAPLLALLCFFKKAQPKPFSTLLLPLLVAALGCASIIYTIGTKYANLNHAIIFFFALAWLLAIFFQARPYSGGCLYVLLSAFSCYIITISVPQRLYAVQKMSSTVDELQGLNLQGKTIFVEDPVLGIVCGATPLFVDIATFIMVWDKEQIKELEKGLGGKSYPVVIINENDSLGHQPHYFWTESFLSKLKANYQKIGPVSGNGDVQDLYLPRTEPLNSPQLSK